MDSPPLIQAGDLLQILWFHLHKATSTPHLPLFRFLCSLDRIKIKFSTTSQEPWRRSPAPSSAASAYALQLGKGDDVGEIKNMATTTR
jgi:hypothetical protein